MKYVVASDIHGSSYYLRLLLDFYKKEGAQKLILLGDLLYHGARNALPKEYDTIACTALYNRVKDDVVCVRGNCDSEVDQMVLSFPIGAEFCILDLDGKHVYCTHGHKIPENLQKDDVLLCGHFHVPAFEQRENYFYVNCGSVSIPKENSPHACMVVEGRKCKWIDLETGVPFRVEKL
ncbi:MAG: phosphodiesterase [Clostridia bacterium]|nr:phosphodiesterase [Clostridia bacterium]